MSDFWRPHILKVAAQMPEEERTPAEVLEALSRDMGVHPEEWEKLLGQREEPSTDTVVRILRELPSRDTVARILETATSDDWQQYRYVQWPESLGTPDLPWEASAAVLELLRFF